jgi:Kef-type K+ transport system membrane component KefB
MSRLRLPAAAGFILVGAGLGPSGAGLLDSSTSIDTLAELGVLMLLFIIGMEMRLAQFAKSLPLALGITGVTCAVIPASVALFTLAVDGEVLGGLVIGFMLSISSTAVAMKMMEEAEERDTHAGRMAVAILVAQDLAVVTGGRTFLNLILLMLSGEKFEDAFSTALILSPVGEFSFVLAGAGMAAGALSDEGYKLAIAVIAMSLLVSPLFFLIGRVDFMFSTLGASVSRTCQTLSDTYESDHLPILLDLSGRQ